MSGTRASNDRPLGTGGVKRGRLQQEAAANGSRVTVVLGAQWGDEGKGKVVDLLATDADIISRCQVRAGRGLPGRGRGLPPSPPTQREPSPWAQRTLLPRPPRPDLGSLSDSSAAPTASPTQSHPPGQAGARGRAMNTSR